MRDTHDRRWQILTVLSIAVFVVVVDNTVVNVALPTLARDMRASNSALQWIVDGYSLPFAGLLLAGGGLSDRLGRRLVMQSGLIAFGVFSFVAAHATNVTNAARLARPHGRRRGCSSSRRPCRC